MIRVGMTINLNDFQSEKIDIEFPSQLLPSKLTDPDLPAPLCVTNS